MECALPATICPRSAALAWWDALMNKVEGLGDRACNDPALPRPWPEDAAHGRADQTMLCLYEAPKPWGPWTTAYYTDDWGQDRTHGYRLPSKWIGPDGLTMWLVYSGRGQDDAFCVRKCHLTVR